MNSPDKEDLEEITIDGLGRLKIGKQSRGLYWDDKRVQTESVVVLSGAQSMWAIGVAVATILSALTTIAVNVKTFLVEPKKPEIAAPGIAMPQVTGSTNPLPVKPSDAVIPLRPTTPVTPASASKEPSSPTLQNPPNGATNIMPHQESVAPSKPTSAIPSSK